MANPRPKAGPGRPRGLENKVTRDLKAMILGALDNGGGQKWLEKQMVDNPNAFMTLLGKILPTQITGDPSQPVYTANVTPEQLAEAVNNVRDKF